MTLNYREKAFDSRNYCFSEFQLEKDYLDVHAALKTVVVTEATPFYEFSTSFYPENLSNGKC